MLATARHHGPFAAGGRKPRLETGTATVVGERGPAWLVVRGRGRCIGDSRLPAQAGAGLEKDAGARGTLTDMQTYIVGRLGTRRAAWRTAEGRRSARHAACENPTTQGKAAAAGAASSRGPEAAQERLSARNRRAGHCRAGGTRVAVLLAAFRAHPFSCAGVRFSHPILRHDSKDSTALFVATPPGHPAELQRPTRWPRSPAVAFVRPAKFPLWKSLTMLSSWSRMLPLRTGRALLAGCVRCAARNLCGVLPGSRPLHAVSAVRMLWTCMWPKELNEYGPIVQSRGGRTNGGVLAQTYSMPEMP